MSRFSYTMPFSKVIGFRLSKWSFLAVLAFPVKCVYEDWGHIMGSINTGKYHWLKPQFGFRIFPVRP